MKAKFFWTYIIVLVFSSFVIASPDRDDMKYTDRKVKDLRDEWKYHNDLLVDAVNEKKAQIEGLQASVKGLQASVEELQARVDSLWKKEAKNLETIGRKGDKTDIKANVALWITIPIVIVICSILCFAFWPRKSRAASLSPTLSDQHKCPRCGWEHGPNDTVCRNPNCKTQF
jgi:hypothetical protein